MLSDKEAYIKGSNDCVVANGNTNRNIIHVPRRDQQDAYYKGYANTIGPCYLVKLALL
jgi:hypothetical protein